MTDAQFVAQVRALLAAYDSGAGAPTSGDAGGSTAAPAKPPIAEIVRIASEDYGTRTFRRSSSPGA